MNRYRQTYPGPGIVVIGRNEGERLRRCLVSVRGRAGPLVYVDSGSSDASVALARDLGVDVLELDGSMPHSAARARNAGIAHLCRQAPWLEAIQLLDGDCELLAGWLETGCAALRRHADAAIVFGHCRERERTTSVYSRLCDLEWQVAPGVVDACGGNAMIRPRAWAEVGGYDPSLIAGEEPELCLRLRRKGWTIRCLDRPMVLHDAAIDRFGQFCRRSLRAGHSDAERAWRQGWREPRSLRRVVATLFWGAGLPGVTLVAVAVGNGAGLLLLVGYGVLYRRARAVRLRLGNSRTDAALYGRWLIVMKLAEAAGIARFAWRRLILRRHPELIEYKTGTVPGAERHGKGSPIPAAADNRAAD